MRSLNTGPVAPNHSICCELRSATLTVVDGPAYVELALWTNARVNRDFLPYYYHALKGDTKQQGRRCDCKTFPDGRSISNRSI
jgi:hypothetical protein